MRPQDLTSVRVASLRSVPVRVTRQTAAGPELIVENAGAYVRGGKLRIADNRTALLEEWLDREVAEIARQGRTTHRITLRDGVVLTVEVTGRCACGSPLKNFDAFRVNP